MKILNKMKVMNRINLLAILSLISFSVFGADLVVHETGAGGAYTTIQDALANANDGDRILVVDKLSEQPWEESITITKSLTISSAFNDSSFLMRGNVTIAPGAAGKEINIVGMVNTKGDIAATLAAPAGSRTIVTIVGCDLIGDVLLDFDNYQLEFASNKIYGNIKSRYARILGNEIGGAIDILDDTNPVANESVLVIGNKIDCVSDPHCVQCNTESYKIEIRNNYITGPLTMIQVDKTIASGLNSIVNNTMFTNDSKYGGAVLWIESIGVDATMEIYNNLINAIDDQPARAGIRLGFNFNGDLNAFDISYNHVDKDLPILIDTRLEENGTNVVTTDVEIDEEGRSTTTTTVDVGDPRFAYYDIDLSPNDIGAYGGSHTLDNYHPLVGSARVYFLNAPHAVYLGDPINIEINGYDK